MKEIIEKYKKYLIVDENSYSTITSYIQKVSHFLEQVELDNISTETIRDYFFNLKDKLAPRSLNTYKSAIRNFLYFLEKDDIRVPKSGKVDKKPPEFITLKFFENNVIPMVEVLFSKVLKTKTILYFMFYSGLRVSDVATLKRENFDLENLTVRAYNKKSKKERILPYPKRVKNILEQYFSFEPEIKTAFNMKAQGIKEIFKKLNPYFKDINLHPHLLRHSYATHLRKLNIKGEDIQYFLGHSSINSTMIYAHADSEAIIKDYHKKIK